MRSLGKGLCLAAVLALCLLAAGCGTARAAWRRSPCPPAF